MKTIKTGAGYIAKVDDDEYEKWSAFSWGATVFKNANREISIIYASRTLPTVNYRRGKKIYMHREIMGITDPNIEVDHIDHDGLNNTKENLRVCVRTQNHGNQRMRTDNTSGYKGVTWNRNYGKWKAQINFRGKHIFVGNFNRIEDAAKAYKGKADQLFGEFAFTSQESTRRLTA